MVTEGQISHHFTGVDLGNDRLHRPTIVQTLEVNEQEPTRQLHLHTGGDKLGRRFSWGVLETRQGQREKHGE